MTTILFQSPVFGPVHSRRLGASLGINLLPADGKICSFDCIYCECGLNEGHRPHSGLAERQEVARKLEDRLLEMRRLGEPLEAITFAGNGEPTSHPQFPEIVDDVVCLRDKYCKNVKICVLTNAFHIAKPRVFEALLKTDEPMLKLDAVDPNYIKMVNRPNSYYDLASIVEVMKNFGRRCVIQTMFLSGTWNGKSADNTGDEYVLPWVETVALIKPKLVTIYTIARETPSKTLKKADLSRLHDIAQLVEARGIPVTVSG